MARRENFEDESFEREWKDAFEDASEQPSTRVWSNIERELAYKQLAVLRRKARFYQWTAAAAIFIASFLGINYLVSDDAINNGPVTTRNTEILSPSAIESTDDVFTNESIAEVDPEVITEERLVTTGKVLNTSVIYNDSGTGEKIQLPPVNRTLIAVNSKHLNESMISYQVESDTRRKMYNKPINGKFVKKSSKNYKDQERFWAGVGVGSGSFDPNYQSGATNLLASSLNLATAENYAVANTFRIDNQSPAVREGMKSGTMIDMGLNFGVRISENWLLESGVFFTQAGAITQTNVVVESPNVVEPIAASSETRGVTQLSGFVSGEKLIQYSYQDVNMDNQFQFASFPVKAGYILIDGKFNIVVNAGVATNLYLGNKLTDPKSEVANVSIGPGSSSPYREISFAGMGGLQIGYSFFDQFEFTFEPYMRQPITSLTKENSSFNASPSGMGINTGVRYRFN